ncbi:hypothetical protein RRG08_035739 [Elysia crispata]|uniref:MULE transposase domain-containing protein n=1 Tax=Elysia crispata TaxID=231223 RepID=A0AAE0YJ55_9GAST|nr:hypothetical protein RRG08_035739 [Elysia crispata]
MDLKFTETSKGKPAALLDGHLFRLMSESKSSRTWRCTQKDCKARFTTSLNTTDIQHGMTSHCHGKTEDSVSLKKLQLRQSCKRKAEDDLTERPRKIIVTEGQSMETNGLNQRDIGNVRKAMWRQRRKHQPKLPISRMDALRAISEIETRQDVKIVTDDETQIACVYSPSAMVYLHRNQDMFDDGTFKSCPKHFEQLYTIITFADGMYVPVAFFLLPGSSKEVYQNMFKLLHSLHFEVTGSCLEGKILHLDFEQAAHAAAKLGLPGLALKSCLFHLKQNVCESYAFDILEQAPDDQRIDEYLEYLAKTYICSHSSFPPTLWASTDVCSKRTTNGSEAFHRKLNSLFYASHPSVFELVDRLQEIVFENSFKIRDGPSRPAKLSDRKKHDWMKSSIAEYVDGSLTTHAFLRRICNASLPRTNLH